MLRTRPGGEKLQQTIRLEVHLGFFQCVTEIALDISWLASIGAGESKRPANLPKKSLGPVPSPDVAYSRSRGSWQEQRPKRLFQEQRVLRVDRAEHSCGEEDWRRHWVKGHIENVSCSLPGESEDCVKVRVALNQALLDQGRGQIGTQPSESIEKLVLSVWYQRKLIQKMCAIIEYVELVKKSEEDLLELRRALSCSI